MVSCLHQRILSIDGEEASRLNAATVSRVWVLVPLIYYSLVVCAETDASLL